MIADAILAFVQSQTDHPVIFANQNGPRPQGLFLTVSIVSTVREGQAWQSMPDENGIARYKQAQLVTASIQCYGEGCLGVINDIRTSVEKFTVRKFLHSLGICFASMAREPADNSVIAGTEWEARASMDMVFREAVTFSDTVGLIETVNVAAEQSMGVIADKSVSAKTGVS
jgi:hypothetical protein